MKKALKVFVSVFLVAVMALSLTACKKNGDNDGANGIDKTNWEVVEMVEKPTYTSGTVTMEEFESKYRPYTDWRIYEIRTTKNEFKPADGGTAYYVSNRGNAENDGLSPETPMPDYASVRKKGLKTGDVIYFERGSIWRDQIEVGIPGVTLTAYGEGKAPRFYGSPANSAQEGYWLETDVENVYVYKEPLLSMDVGSIIFDDKECAYKSLYSSEDQSNSSSKKYVNSYKDLKEDLQMYHEPKNKKLYLYCEGGNPADRFDSIELIYKVTMFVKADNVTVDGLCMKYACFGISGSSSINSKITGLTVRNCEFGWIGGNIQGTAGQSTTRYGNGIEIWGAAEDFTVTNNYFWQIYDAAVTFQYDGKVFNDVKNVKFNDNVFEYCNYSIEYFHRTNGGKVYDFEIKNNLCWYAGEGLCNQRPDHAEVSHIRSGWATQGNATKIENNLFAVSLKTLARTLDYSDIGGAYNNNVYAQIERRELAMNGKNSTAFKMDANAKNNIETKLGDKNATVITIKR